MLTTVVVFCASSNNSVVLHAPCYVPLVQASPSPQDHIHIHSPVRRQPVTKSVEESPCGGACAAGACPSTASGSPCSEASAALAASKALKLPADSSASSTPISNSSPSTTANKRAVSPEEVKALGMQVPPPSPVPQDRHVMSKTLDPESPLPPKKPEVVQANPSDFNDWLNAQFDEDVVDAQLEQEEREEDQDQDQEEEEEEEQLLDSEDEDESELEEEQWAEESESLKALDDKADRSNEQALDAKDLAAADEIKSAENAWSKLNGLLEKHKASIGNDKNVVTHYHVHLSDEVDGGSSESDESAENSSGDYGEVGTEETADALSSVQNMLDKQDDDTLLKEANVCSFPCS